MLFCPVCSTRLTSRKCKLICEKCGYYMSCAILLSAEPYERTRSPGTFPARAGSVGDGADRSVRRRNRFHAWSGKWSIRQIIASGGFEMVGAHRFAR